MDALTALIMRNSVRVAGIQDTVAPIVTNKPSSMLYLPEQDWRVTPRDTLNDSAQPASESQLTVAAENAPLRVMYGRVRIGPQIACVITYVGYLYVLAVWGHGEIDSFDSIEVDDKVLSANTSSTLASEGLKRTYWGGIEAVHYRGTATQTKDESLRVAFLLGQSPSVLYTDNLPGICYSVFRFQSGSTSGFPRINAIIKGRKVWTGAANAWSDNPAYCLADFVTNTTYGMGRTVDWASVASVAADCNELAGSEVSRTLNLSLENVQPVTSWANTLRTYANCWMVQSGANLRFISDKDPAFFTPLLHSSGHIQKVGTLKKRGVQNVPTVMQITYTDTSVLPWRDAVAVAYAGGGTSLPVGVPRRESSVSLPGITRYSQAMREAIERLNKLTLNDLSFDLSVFDEQLVLDVGDCVSVSHPIGLTNKYMRVMRCSGEYGRYNLSLVEFDPAVYDGSVATAPTWPDTQLPSPTGTLADPTSFAVAEELYIAKDSTIQTRIRVTWVDVVDPYHVRYWVEGRRNSDGVVMFSGYSSSTEYVSPSVVEGVLLSITLYAERSSTGTKSIGDFRTITPIGKAAPPANVTGIGLRTSSVGAEFYWTPNTEVDLSVYEYQFAPYGTTAWGAYDVYTTRTASTLININVIGTTTGGPGGTILVRAVDTSGNRSAAVTAFNYQIQEPLVPTVTYSNVHENYVLLNWNDCKRGYPINRYEVHVYKAGVWKRVMYTKSTSMQIIETEGASTQYKYRVLCYDETMLLYDDVSTTNITPYITLTAPVKAALTASKTVETDASGNLVSVAISGSGSYVKTTSPTISSPTLTSPVLGTPTSGNLANCTFPTLNQNTSGYAATAYTLSGSEVNWATYRTSAVANMLGWKNYGNNHVIFDASQSTSPTGSVVNSTNAGSVWVAGYPTLMGWNGSSTYGVRVDSARISDSTSGNAATATYLSATAQTSLITGRTSSMAMALSDGSQGSFVCRSSGTGDANLAGLSFSNDSYAIKLGVRADGAFGLGGWYRGAWSWYSDASGNMVAAGNVTAYSDPRLKENVVTIDNALSIVSALDGVRFTWKHGIPHIESKAGKADIGVLADQVEAVLPELITESIEIEGETYKTVCYEKIVPVLIQAIKELQGEIAELRKLVT